MEISKIINSQKYFFNTNKTKDVRFRIETLKKLKTILKENEKDLYNSIYSDFKKSEFETYMSELALIYNELNDAIRNLKKWSKQKRVRTNFVNLPSKSYIIPEPLGTVLVISAWNYPYLISLIPAISAIAAGNTVVVKPSEITINCSNIISKLINTNFPENYFTVIEGGVDTTTELLKEKWDKIFFTGSSTVGKIIYKAAADKLTPVTLELGGKSPTFVLNDCNINMTAKRIVWSKFFNAGQTCIAPDYILVEKKIEQKLLEALKQEIKNNYSNTDTINENYVQIINKRHFQRLINLIPTDRIYSGGEYNVEERIINPTILHNIDFEDDIMKDEIFGPILPIISFDNLNETIANIKKKDKPLSLYIYSNDKKRIK
ncbi:MAG: aldehyde dehydrogenase family protein, partial [Flavobacteriales bacterium]|nr:aldehyde dehydrogenase family protein [Flavobacteriales bacterium]